VKGGGVISILLS